MNTNMGLTDERIKNERERLEHLRATFDRSTPNELQRAVRRTPTTDDLIVERLDRMNDLLERIAERLPLPLANAPAEPAE